MSDSYMSDKINKGLFDAVVKSKDINRFLDIEEYELDDFSVKVVGDNDLMVVANKETGEETYLAKHYKDQHEIMNDMISEIRKRKRDDTINKIIND